MNSFNSILESEYFVVKTSRDALGSTRLETVNADMGEITLRHRIRAAFLEDGDKIRHLESFDPRRRNTGADPTRERDRPEVVTPAGYHQSEYITAMNVEACAFN